MKKRVVVVIGLHRSGQADLLEVAQALCAFAFLFGSAKRWQEHARQNGDDRDDDQQFNQGKSAARVTRASLRVCGSGRA